MKKTLRLLIVVALLLVLTCSSAFAWTDYVQKKQNDYLYTMVRTANIQVKALVRVAQLTPYNDIGWLLSSVNAVTRPVFKYAKSIGATVICEYETYYIDGRYVKVDPLKVINVVQP